MGEQRERQQLGYRVAICPVSRHGNDEVHNECQVVDGVYSTLAIAHNRRAHQRLHLHVHKEHEAVTDVDKRGEAVKHAVHRRALQRVCHSHRHHECVSFIKDERLCCAVPQLPPIEDHLYGGAHSERQCAKSRQRGDVAHGVGGRKLAQHHLYEAEDRDAPVQAQRIIAPLKTLRYVLQHQRRSKLHANVVSQSSQLLKNEANHPPRFTPD
mmetsp:Transcript_5666/g.16182  ORF Transcript_5666/g.16182 Transcript_5666/m.16182 type:complete len:211 (+) Transcript_5666:1213-1845(+)